MDRRYSIGEIARILRIKPHVIRYWEDEIPFIAPQKSKSGRRVYTNRELQLLARLKHLLYEKRYTIEGARERIWKETASSKVDLTARIAAVRGDLLSVWDKLKGGEPKDSKTREIRIIEQWSKRGQEHLFAYWSDREEDKKRILLDNLEALNFDHYELLLRRLGEQEQHGEGKRIEPIRCIPRRAWVGNPKAKALGEELLAAGKAAFLTVAGGQGSRLGFEGPKGCFPVSPIRRATLFQLFSEKILAARRRYGRAMYWYIMTSPLNLEQTRCYFADNGYLGLPKEEVRFFAQGLLPSLSARGKLLLAESGGLFLNPNGHGGMISALQNSGNLDHMISRGVDRLFYCQVDNPMVRLPDAPFLGLHAEKRSQLSSKVVEKLCPEEKIGVIGSVDGKPGVIEYSDFDVELQNARNASGTLLFSHGSIAIHIFDVQFLKSHSGQLPLHLARKRIRTWIPDGSGGVMEQREANKFEMFIFDALADAANPLFVETSRAEEFAPLKNKTGVDSIETCRRGLMNLYAGWLQANGIEVPMENQAPRHRIEISPAFAWDAESLGESLKQTPLSSVNRIDEDTLLV